MKGYFEKRTHQWLPNVRFTPKSMTYRDTAYLKTQDIKNGISLNGQAKSNRIDILS